MPKKKKPSVVKKEVVPTYSQERALKAALQFRTSWLTTCSWREKLPKDFKGGRVIYWGASRQHGLAKILGFEPQTWEMTKWESSEAETFIFRHATGPVWLLRPKAVDAAQFGFAREARIGQSLYARGRDLLGALGSTIRDSGQKRIHVEFVDAKDEEILGALVGLELARYRFKDAVSGVYKDWPEEFGFSARPSRSRKNWLQPAGYLGAAMNLARHLVNLPPETLNPTTYAELVKQLFKGSGRQLEIQVWNHQRLKKEKMGLLSAVGQGSDHPPCLVHLRYRPTGSKSKKPVAFVGKGITFDTGGLDIKPASAMRWMKKDMGGSATLVGLCQWVLSTGLKQPMDFYLALAENAVSDRSFAPGDVLVARNGTSVEIHNTDAEGRLALVDALDVAVTQKGNDEPNLVIDVATLTGAIKVALGAELAGLFGNKESLVRELEKYGQERGDLAWHMPLVQRYRKEMRSQFADMNNAVDGFGGAITAALFLQSFVRGKPWAHLDIYAWKDSAEGPYAEGGGNGQAVQMLSRFLEEL